MPSKGLRALKTEEVLAMTDKPISDDVQSILSFELPPKTDPKGRTLAKFTLLVLALAIVMGYAIAGYALRASLRREDTLSMSLTCVRASTVAYDRAIGEAIKLLVDLDVPTGRLVVALSNDDQDQVANAVREIESNVKVAEPIKQQINDAIKARQTALKEC